MLLPVQCVTANFAPTVDVVAITLTPPPGRVTTMTLQALDGDGTLVFEHLYDCAEGLPPVSWDGTLNRNADAETEPWATPLRSPYTLRIDAVVEPAPLPPEDLSDRPLPRTILPCEVRREEVQPVLVQPLPLPQPPTSVTVAVLYHSIELHVGPHNATGQVFVVDSDEDICNRLNDLGYYAGPPARAGVDATLLNRAKERFRKSSATLRNVAAPSNHAFVGALTAAAAHPRPTLVDSGDAPIAAGTQVPAAAPPLRVYVEAIGFESDPVTNRDEFNLQYDRHAPLSKTATEATRKNRPLVPLEVVIYLRGASGARVSVPRAVGAVRVDFQAIESMEDFSTLPLLPSRESVPQTYIESVVRRLVESGQGSSNCLQIYGGIRTVVNNHRNPFWLEAQPYAPYARAQADDVNACAYGRGYVGAVARCRGRAGVYFNPSIIAGDRYTLAASVRFEGGRAAALTLANGPLRAASSPIHVWRRAEVLGVVGWPPRPGNQATLLRTFGEEYEPAYLKLDYANAFLGPIGTICNDQDYIDLLAQVARYKPTLFNGMGADVDLTHLGARPINLLRAPHALAHPEKVFFLSDVLFSELRGQGMEATAEWLLERLVTRVLGHQHREHPAAGLLFLEYAHHADVRAVSLDAGGQIPTMSNGNAQLRGIIDQDGPGFPYYILAHEAGHCFWLRHHENAGGVAADHDPHDHNCMMSYTRPRPEVVPRTWHRPDAYRPHFCGKCNLKLRGWDIGHGHFAGAEGRMRKVDMVFCQDAAEPTLRAPQERAAARTEWAKVSRGQFRDLLIDLPTQHLEKAVVLDTYCRALDTDVFHHTSHGNQRCSIHGRRAATMDLATPRFPLACLHDVALVAAFCRTCGALFAGDRASERIIDAQRGPHPPALKRNEVYTIVDEALIRYRAQGRTLTDLVDALAAPLRDLELDAFGTGVAADLDRLYTDHLIKPGDGLHPLHGVIQFVTDNDSLHDMELTYEDLRAGLADNPAPRILMFLSSCLIGWDPAFARLFIDKGTRYVIAFRSRYETAQALAFSARFYGEWSTLDLDPDQLPAAFLTAAGQCPHAEPVLYTAANVRHTYAATMRNGSGVVETLSWATAVAPHFPTR